MKKWYGSISKKDKSSLFGYEISLRDQKCRPIYLGEDEKRYYALYLADNKPKGLGRNKEIPEGAYPLIPNQIRPHF